MSHETDSFIDEVTEEVRRDRLYALFRRYGWIGLLLIAVIVGGAAWREYASSRDRAAAQQWGDAVLAAQNSDDVPGQLAALENGGNPDRAALADLLAAGAALEAGDVEAAGPMLDAAYSGAEDPVIRDLARLKAILVRGNTMNPAERDAILSELSQPGAPFRLLALEQKAVALAAAGRSPDALTLIRETLAEDGISQALRGRLTELMISLGGDPEVNPVMPPAVASAAAAPDDVTVSDDAATAGAPAAAE
ncbi:tetratricopeptide repeat protein [Paracoccus aerodenitrificans]|uniref:tetratricopeptide repeat protein n=1 Tax=Paracoccus aerodenitrificans TaxID=3017781 RepID=UPI0022F0F849|nr:tetratricopeptide repeat protein [Paracoccus aerodenitrificans]WBU63252.1 tetratricopeptide repeat protein [Paracoccus aerodenitrificans]